MLATEKLNPEEKTLDLGNECSLKAEKVAWVQRTSNVRNATFLIAELFRIVLQESISVME